VQTEDEIAAITMAIGAALTGARSATSTSGPGFSLMAEGLGWAVSMKFLLLSTTTSAAAHQRVCPHAMGRMTCDLQFMLPMASFPGSLYVQGISKSVSMMLRVLLIMLSATRRPSST